MIYSRYIYVGLVNVISKVILTILNDLLMINCLAVRNREFLDLQEGLNKVNRVQPILNVATVSIDKLCIANNGFKYSLSYLLRIGYIRIVHCCVQLIFDFGFGWYSAIFYCSPVNLDKQNCHVKQLYLCHLENYLRSKSNMQNIPEGTMSSQFYRLENFQSGKLVWVTAVESCKL